MEQLRQAFKKSEELSPEQIINELIRPGNIRLKSRIMNVEAFLKLRTMADWYEMNGLTIGKAYIEKYIDNFLNDMVSDSGKSREELIEAFKNYNEAQKLSITQKLMGGGNVKA